MQPAARAAGRPWSATSASGWTGARGAIAAAQDASPRRKTRWSAARLARLRAALSSRRGPWGSALVEPEVLLSLARTPPADAAALADVAGVGAALAERWGGTILAALGSIPAPRATPSSPRRAALESWRRRTAREAGVPEYVVLGNAALDALAASDARDARALAAVPGLGPRALAKHARALLDLIAAAPPVGYLVPMDQGDAEILERIEAGERVFRPGTGGESARRIFEALVRQLRELRDRGFVDMPERSVAYAADEEAGAFLMAGPCYLTEAGRTALQEFRRGERRQADRRGGDRRSPDGSAERAEAERRQAERRQGDRRR